ncbi:MAG: hypothetical protein OEZ23_03615, partial [Gammaproteobacteria bacterium]|nr:hypothetical protein [Gammaproteobacteria bacterium]
ARGLAAFAPYTETFARSGGTQLPAHLSNNGHDMSYGWAVKMGLIWQASDTFSLALSYQSKAAMGEFDDYADLFAQSGGFDMPSALRAGISWHYSAGMAIHLDVEEIYYTDVDSVGNSMDNLYDCPTVGGSDFESCLGGKRGAGFSWDDMTVYKLGFEWILPGLEGYTLRAGYSHANQPIGEDQLLFNILAPGVVEDHLTFGFTRQLANEQEYSLSFMYAPEKSISGNNPFDPSQNLTAKMDQWELEFSYSW